MIAAEKKAITKKWMENVVSTINNWIDVTVEMHNVEKMTLCVNLKMDIFKQHLQLFHLVKVCHLLLLCILVII